MRIRLRDIAERLNVSVVTVSKVLRNQTDISPETRARVLHLMRELNYRPNVAARSLATGRTWSIGLIVPSLLHSFFAEVAEGIVQVLSPAGYGLFISSAEEDPELEARQIEQQISRQVDALLVASCQSDPAILQHKCGSIPLVLIDRCFPGFKANFVGNRDESIGRHATEVLLKSGCKAVAHIRGPKISTADGRFRGYRKALELHRMPFRPELVVQVASESGELSGAKAMRHLLTGRVVPDGVFCFNDPIAAGALEAIDTAGFRVPDDISVIACGNCVWSRFMRVPLSTVDQHAKTIGVQAAKLALRLIAGEKEPRQGTFVKTKIVLRGSTRDAAVTAEEALQVLPSAFSLSSEP